MLRAIVTAPPLRRDETPWQAVRRATVRLWLLVFLPIVVLSAAGAGKMNAAATLALAVKFGAAVLIAMLLVRGDAVLRDRPPRSRALALMAMVCGAALALGGVHLLLSPLDGTARFVIGTRRLAPAASSLLIGGMIGIVSFSLTLLYSNRALLLHRAEAQARALDEAQKAATEAQLVMLRYQLNPHFLFNTLNAISSLVVTGRNAQAEEMLNRLSEFLRATLLATPGGFTPLDAELAVVQDYLGLEAVRFGERLRVEYDCAPETAGLLVPSFILQPLVENAVKYAVTPSVRPTTIAIASRLDGTALELTVRDDGAGAATPAPPGTGVGLANARARLRAMSDDAASLETRSDPSGFTAIIRMAARRAPAAA